MKNTKKSLRCPLVSLIVLNWNGKEIIKNCLNSLLKNTKYPNYKVIVVDNGSTDGSPNLLEKEFGKKVDLIINKENLGFSKGMNIGIKYVLNKYNPKYVGLLNNDLLFPDKFWLQKIIEIMERDKRIGVATPIFIFPDGKVQKVGEKLSGNLALTMIKILPSLPEEKYEEKLHGIKEVDVFLGAAFIIRKEVMEKCGLLDERYSPFLVEEVEYSFRIKKYKYKSVTVCDSKVIHLLGYSMRKLTQKDIKKDLFKFYVVARNTFLFSLEYYGFFKSLLITLPIITFAAFFRRKDKRKGLSFSNLGFQKALIKRIFLIPKAVKDAFVLKRKEKRNNTKSAGQIYLLLL
ncbi:MAG: glycosyltransferase family 2 protein [Candidatus Aenigmatarchaeota archaeon]